MRSSPDTEVLGKNRYRRAAVSGGISMLARGVQVGTSLITVPLTLRYLGTERFGLWMTISSVLAMAAFADFGVGNGVLNTVAKAFGEDDTEGIRRAISSGFTVLSLIALAACGLFFSVYSFVPWASVFKVVSAQAKAEAGPSLRIFAVCFTLNIALDVVQRVQLGIQEGYRFGLWQMCGSVLGLAGVLTGIRLHAGLPGLVLALAGAPVLATFFNALHFFGWVRPDLRPGSTFVSRKMIVTIMRLGTLFFVLQLVGSLAYSADSFLIARTLGAVHVPEYAIPQRMFTMISMMSAMLMTPLWPAYGEAMSRGDFGWIRRTLSRTLLVVFGGASAAACTVLLLSHRLLGWWVGNKAIHPPFLLLAGLAVWCVLDCCGNALAVFMNGASVMRFQILTASIFGVACVSAKIIFLQRFGVAAIPWSTIVTYGLCTVIPCAVFIPRTLRRLQSKAPALAILETAIYPFSALQARED